MEMLGVERLFAGYDSEDIIKGVSFQVEKFRKTCIIGPNGSGKSTLFKALFGALLARRGKVFYEGEDITNLSPHERISRGISYVIQGRNVFPAMTVQENLEMGAYLRKDASEVERDMTEILEKFPILNSKRKEYAGNLSGGERQVLTLAMGLIQRPKLLLIDEPSIGLQPSSLEYVYEEMERINKEQEITLVIIEQNARRGLIFADYAFVLDLGRIAFRGTAEEILNDEEVRRLYVGAG